MLTHEKLNFYARYKGNWENWHRGMYFSQSKEPDLLQEGEWYLIDESIQDLYLIQHKLVEESYAKKLEAALSARCKDTTVIERLRELVPYQYGLWDEKAHRNRFIDWVFRLFT